MNRTRLDFGVVSTILFAAQAHQTELTQAIAELAALPTLDAPVVVGDLHAAINAA